MLEEVTGSGRGGLRPLSPGEKARARAAERTADRPADGGGVQGEVADELRALVERVKQADTFRKERVHAVLEKLQKGELVTPDAVRQAAQRILLEGL